MLDDVETVGPGGGFPDHPHSGQETISYMLEGSCVHQDSNGSRGILNPGDLQFMKAGRGRLKLSSTLHGVANFEKESHIVRLSDLILKLKEMHAYRYGLHCHKQI